MSIAPVPRQPQSSDYSSLRSAAEVTPVLALKEMVARLHREQTKVQDLLSSLSFALRSFNNLNQFLELIPLIASRVTDADAAALILLRPDGQVRLDHLYCHEGLQCQNIRTALERTTRHLRFPSAQTSETAQILDQQLHRHLEAEVRYFSTSILTKSAENHERGRLYIFSRDPDYEWTETRQQLVQLVANQTAVAIENDELTVELRKNERLARELEIGAEIQLQLLPSHCPQIQGIELAADCKTASRVGGDYYDFIPLNFHIDKQLGQDRKIAAEDSRWGLVIGDVMGKGVPAGLIMTMTRGMIRAEVLNEHSPARILQHLNHVMYTDLENSNRFVTLFYSEYDPKTQILSYSNAAHNPPLLWQAATDQIQRLDTLGMLIGLDTQAQYHELQVQLHPGDTVLYYTDGFTDAANQSGDRLDEENLTQAFLWACHHCRGPQAILEYLFNRVEQFIGLNNRNTDDMTLIVMQAKSA